MFFAAQVELVKGTKSILVLLSRTSVDGKDYYLDFAQMLGNEGVVKLMQSVGERVYADSVEGFDLPFMTGEGNNLANFTQVYGILANQVSNENQLKQVAVTISGALNKQIGKEVFKADDITEYYNAIQKFKKYREKELAFKIAIPLNYLKNYQRTSELINSINSSLTAHLSFISSGINKNEFMRSANDRVFIKLPSYEELYSQTFESLMPDIRSIFQPYKNPKFYTPEYNKYLSKEDNELDIIGYTDNNDLPVQDNEQDFYNAMCELIRYGASQAYPDKDVEECIKQNIGSTDVRDFLIELCLKVAGWNWMHTNLLPPVKLATADDDDSDDNDDKATSSDEDDMQGNKMFFMQDVYTDGEEILKAYILDATRNNIFAPAEAVVKLLRWGSRKPSRIKLQGAEKYFDMNKFFLVSNSGSFANLEVIKVNGCDYVPVKLIMANGKFADMKYLTSIGLSSNILNLPVGLACIKSYSNGQQQLVLMSMIDVVEAALGRNKELTIDGLTLNKTIEFKGYNLEEETLELEEAITLALNDLSSNVIFYRDSTFKDMYMKYNIPSIKVSHLTVLREFLYNKEVSYIFMAQCFDSHEDLVDRVNQYRLPVQKFLDANIGKDLLPPVLKTANEMQLYRINKSMEPTFEQILNIYASNMLASSENIEPHMTRPTTNADSAVNEVANKLSAMTAFGGNDNVKPVASTGNEIKQETNNVSGTVTPAVARTATPVEQSAKVVTGFDVSTLLCALSADDVAIDLFDKDANGTTISVGRVVQRVINGKKVFVFARPEVKVKLGTSKSNILHLVKFIFDALAKIAQNNPTGLQTKFADIESIKYFTDYFSKRKW